MSDAQSMIDTLKAFWTNGDGQGLIDSMQIMPQLVKLASQDPVSKQLFSSNYVFSTALISEASIQDSIDSLLKNSVFSFALSPFNVNGAFHPPRWHMLETIRDAIMPGWLSMGDPWGLAPWIGSVSVSGGAMQYAIADDPDPAVRASALDLVRNSSFPIEWVPLLKTALDKLDTNLPSSPWDQTTRAVLAAQSARGRARVFEVANVAAQANFAKLSRQLTVSDGSVATMPPPPARPWYKRIELWGGAVGGLVGGAHYAEHRRKTS